MILQLGAVEEHPLRTQASAPVRISVMHQKEEAAPQNIIHIINPTDTIYGISIRYNRAVSAYLTKVELIRRANNLWCDNLLYIKTELVIPTTETKVYRSRSSTDSGTSVRSHRDSFLARFADAEPIEIPLQIIDRRRVF
jgi:LysM repeat protein